MDLVTQGLLGAAAAQAVLGRRLGRAAAIFGAIGGVLPDLDVFIPFFADARVLRAMPADPALPMEYHRHVTHALCVIPVGGAIAALPFALVKTWRSRFGVVLAAATIGCATHGLLDTCTSYGTYLLWPFVDRRLAWDVVSIIDPVFTTVLLIGVVWAAARRSLLPARAALAAALLYQGLGAIQHSRASAVQAEIAAGRGASVERGRVMPTLGNLLVWRSIYESQGRLYADALRIGRPGAAGVRTGTSLPAARFDDLPAQARESPRVRHVFDGLEAFADGYVAALPDRPEIFGDMRYSLETAGFEPLWGIAVTTGNPGATVRWVHPRSDRTAALSGLWRDVVDAARFSPPER